MNGIIIIITTLFLNNKMTNKLNKKSKLIKHLKNINKT